jgi:hypothetical protein
MTTAVLEQAVEVQKHSFPWQAMLAFLTEPESNAGTVLLQRNSLSAEATGDIAADTLLGVIGRKAATRARIHKLADQDEPDSK